jgi:phosphopantetheinyl transferase
VLWRLCRFKFSADQKRALVSRLMQRRAVQTALGIPWGEIQIKRTKGKKPFLANEVRDRPISGPLPLHLRYRFLAALGVALDDGGGGFVSCRPWTRSVHAAAHVAGGVRLTCEEACWCLERASRKAVGRGLARSPASRQWWRWAVATSRTCCCPVRSACCSARSGCASWALHTQTPADTRAVGAGTRNPPPISDGDGDGTVQINVPGAPNFNYNVSHEGHFVVLASEPHTICGVDCAAPQQLRRGKTQSMDDIYKVRSRTERVVGQFDGMGGERVSGRATTPSWVLGNKQ